MATLQFGEVEGTEVEPEDQGRADLPSYRAYLDGVEKKTAEAAKDGKGYEARLVVATGEPVILKSGEKSGRGKEESKHDRNFRAVAKERSRGITIIPEHLGDNETLLRISLKPLRTFTDLTVAKRDRGRINYQAQQNAAKAAASENPREKAKLEQKAKELAAEVASLDVEIAELQATLEAYAKAHNLDVEELTTEQKMEAFAAGNGAAPDKPAAPAAKATPPKAPAAK